MNFIEFILTEERMELAVNAKDESGFGPLQELYRNIHLQSLLYKLIPLLFRRGYKLTECDREFILPDKTIGNSKPEIEYLRLGYYNSLSSMNEVTLIRKNESYLFFIESAIQNRIIGSNLKTWVQYMMPILSNYKQYWKYTKEVLANTDLGKLLEKVDKKRTIQKKVEEYRLETFEQDDEFHQILWRLYPEIFLF